MVYTNLLWTVWTCITDITFHFETWIPGMNATYHHKFLSVKNHTGKYKILLAIATFAAKWRLLECDILGWQTVRLVIKIHEKIAMKIFYKNSKKQQVEKRSPPLTALMKGISFVNRYDGIGNCGILRNIKF